MSGREYPVLPLALPAAHLSVDEIRQVDSVRLFVERARSILLSLSKGVPVLAAGIREGKNDVNAHVDYFGVGLDLRTESPRPDDIQRGAERILNEPQWKQNVARLRAELSRYHPNELIDTYLSNGEARG